MGTAYEWGNGWKEKQAGMKQKKQQKISDRYEKKQRSSFAEEEKFSQKKFTTIERQICHLTIGKDVLKGL